MSTLAFRRFSAYLFLATSMALASVPSQAEEAAAVDQPRAVIEKTASELQMRLEGKQDYYADKPAELYDLINDVLLSGFDVEYAGKLVLGKEHWTKATPEQRTRFIDVFYGFLIKTYAKGLLGFDQNKLKVLDGVSYSKDGRKALVRTVLGLDGGDSLQVNYALREVTAGWKIYDVRIDGVSYIQNYRNQFDAEIRAQGIDLVIQRLEAEAAAAEKQNADATAQASST